MNQRNIRKKILLLTIIITAASLVACSRNDIDESDTAASGSDAVINTAETTIDLQTKLGMFDKTSAVGEDILNKARIAAENAAKKAARIEPPVVRAIYLTADMAGHPRGIVNRIKICNETEINAMVIDFKPDEGTIPFKGYIPFADELGISVASIPDIEELMKNMKDNNVYSIARVVTFRDNTITQFHPEYAIKNPDGTLYYDKAKDKGGSTWLNPYNRDTWDYVLSIAEYAAELGFDEIQFDYIRFPTSKGINEADFGDTGGLTKIDIITEFTQYAVERLHKLGVYVSADVYGTIIHSSLDEKLVGQDYEKMSAILDYICPMIYPSHFGNGYMDIEAPDLVPYEIISKIMELSNKRLDNITGHKAIVRPWLQDFTATWIKPHQKYGVEQIREQIQACYDTGTSEWILWNSASQYTVEALMADENFVPVEAEE